MASTAFIPSPARLGETAIAVSTARPPGPASVDPDVAALRPPELLESVPERGDEGLPLRVALGIRHQHADVPHPLQVLRALRRPKRR